jgi:16S rRNA pseudouridine516 synthase
MFNGLTINSNNIVMASKRSRLDRLISRHTGISRGDVRLLLAQGRVFVDGFVATAINQQIGPFSHVTFDGQIIQSQSPVYVMLNKPQGVVSATRDEKHSTVVDLLTRPDRDQLHIVGRLDFNSTGLILLTNDGRWSRYLTQPATKVMKWYQVTLEKPVSADYIEAFAEGMYFRFEDITTRPAILTIINDYTVKVGLVEGRYHQIKRMFGRLQNRVLTLHRVAIGKLLLHPELLAGQNRELSPAEIAAVYDPAMSLKAL